jgi:hypothetical protein
MSGGESQEVTKALLDIPCQWGQTLGQTLCCEHWSPELGEVGRGPLPCPRSVTYQQGEGGRELERAPCLYVIIFLPPDTAQAGCVWPWPGPGDPGVSGQTMCHVLVDCS